MLLKDTWDRTNDQRNNLSRSKGSVTPFARLGLFISCGCEESLAGAMRNQEVGLLLLPQLCQSAERRRGKYPPVHTMVLLGLQAPLLGEHSANEGGRADGAAECKTSPAAGINTFHLRGG